MKVNLQLIRPNFNFAGIGQAHFLRNPLDIIPHREGTVALYAASSPLPTHIIPLQPLSQSQLEEQRDFTGDHSHQGRSGNRKKKAYNFTSAAFLLRGTEMHADTKQMPEPPEEGSKRGD